MTDERSWQGHVVFGALLAAAYLVAVLTVIHLDHGSELAKLARGAYTDTFSPLGLSRAAAWPGSSLGPVSEYPDGPFDAGTYRSALQPSRHACRWAAVGQAVLVFLVATAGHARRRAPSRR